MKKTVLFSVLALTASAFADGDVIASAQKMNGQSRPMVNTNENKMMMKNVVTLTSARPESEHGWYVFADALYWHASVGNTDWAAKYPNSTTTVQELDMHHLNFKWSWGFKVGVGVNMDHDEWDSNLYYTWFRTHNSNHAGVGSLGEIFDNIGTFAASNTTSSPTPISSAKLNWKIHYSMFDWELGRWYFVSNKLSLRPHVGLKGGWIDQNVRQHMRGVVTATTGREKFKNDFWGVGPSIGVNTMWDIWRAGQAKEHRFSLFGDFGGALMYGHFKVTNHQTFAFNGVTFAGLRVHDLNRNLAVPMVQGQLGFSWDAAVNNDKTHLAIKLGYELQYWWRQNQISWIPSALGIGHRLSDDLALQGVTLDFRVDF